MKKRFIPVLLTALGIAVTIRSGAAPADTLSPLIADSLAKISNILFRAHSNNFIIVDALRDGYLEFDKAYQVQVTTDSATVLINGKMLPADISRRYQQRLNDFRYYSGNVPDSKYSVSYTGEGFSLKEILDPGSPFRKLRITKPVDPGRLQAQNNIGRIVGELVRDGIIRDQGNFSINFNSDGLLVNNAPLASAMDTKYRMLFRAFMDVEPKDGKGAYLYSAHSGAGELKK